MTMSWSDAVTESTRKPTRQPRPSYVPPHLRHSGSSYGYGPSTESAQYGFRSSYTGPGRQPGRAGTTRGGRGRGRGGRFWAQQPQNPSPDLNPSDNVSEKFDQLKVTEEDSNGGINFDAYEDIPVEASGADIPPPVDTFHEIDLGECLNHNIKTRCKYVRPTPIQRHAIPVVMAGRDLMACAQTGSGKTAAFCLPIICGVLNSNSVGRSPTRGGAHTVCPTALILSPTRELAGQIHDEAKKFAYQSGVKIVVAYGGAPISQQFRNLERGVDILVATPGRLVDMIERSRVSLRMIKYLALDEADRMLDMGFEPQIRRIVEQMDMPCPGARQTLLFSATFPNEIQRLAADFLSNYIFLAVGRVGSSTDLIAQKIEFVEDMDKRSHLMDHLHSQQANGSHGKPALTLVFVETKRGADALENWLCMNGFPAIAIHGDKVQMERERALRSFKCGSAPILVATDVASRGLDIPHVAHVINFDLPKGIDDYVHRIGRTGRAGNSGLATAFFNDKNQPLAKGLIELMQESNQEVPSWLNEYAEGSQTYSSGGGGSRSQRSGGSRFGGYDFRRSAQSGRESYYGPSSYGYGDCSVGTSAASYNDATVPYGYGNYETIVAGGWE